MSPILEEHKQLARAVLDPEADLTTLCALTDCVRESLDHPDFRFSKQWVERLEGVINLWRDRLMQKGKWESSGGFFIPASTYIEMLRDYQRLQKDCSVIFNRKLKKED